jgi:hypothetical protein
MRPRHHQAILTDHAWQRYQERSWKILKRTKLQSLCTVRLNEAIGKGMIVDYTGAGWFEVIPWLWAVVKVVDDGWLVLTFKVLEGEKEVG